MRNYLKSISAGLCLGSPERPAIAQEEKKDNTQTSMLMPEFWAGLAPYEPRPSEQLVLF
jgi:hypothetical protein